MDGEQMGQRPADLAAQDAAAFQDRGVVASYRHRPPYPPEVFDILAGLIAIAPRRVLDVGCGSGDIARRLVRRVEQVDAVDFSRPMIEAGRRLPDGDHPRLRWLHGRVGEVVLDPPYALVTAAVPFVQSIDDSIESYHSRSGFARERMGVARAAAFDQAARQLLLASHPDGVVSLQVTASVVWGLPGGR